MPGTVIGGDKAAIRTNRALPSWSLPSTDGERINHLINYNEQVKFRDEHSFEETAEGEM